MGEDAGVNAFEIGLNGFNGSVKTSASELQGKIIGIKRNMW